MLDGNILLYAFDTRSANHLRIRDWLESILAGDETVGIPWVAAWAFVRISTNPRLSAQALSVPQAIATIGKLRIHPLVTMINPGRRHQELLLEQMQCAQVRGTDTTDAVLAALAIENGATLASTDAGFRRFPDLRWVNPLAVN